jgi:hypothetical protein
MNLDQSEERRIAAFREVAREIRNNSVVTGGLTIKHWLRQDGEHAAVDVELLPSEPFMALCVSVRKVYMRNGPAHLYNVNKIVGRYDTGEYRQRAAAVRADYELVLRGNEVEFRIQGKRVLHEELFKAWLNGYAFHQDAFEEPFGAALDYAQLQAALGPLVDSLVQKVALQLAGCILEMDDVIADWRGQERLPRITPRTAE